MSVAKKKLLLIQGPLAGVSCSPFRALAQDYGGADYCYSEMISAKTLLQTRIAKRYTHKAPNEGKLCIQLSTTDPHELRAACQKALDYGADFLDLNCGCPVNKIRKKGAGSKLLANTQLLGQLIETMKTTSSVPVSVKIRVDGHSHDHFNLDVLKTVESAGADRLIVHGRHWREDYSTACHYSQIAALVRQASIPLIANGDVSDIKSLNALLSTGCAGVMISRAAVGQPWLFAQLRAQWQGHTYTKPNLAEIGHCFLTHIKGLICLDGEKKAVLQARQLGKYYARTNINHGEYLPRLYQVKTFKDCQMLVADFFQCC